MWFFLILFLLIALAGAGLFAHSYVTGEPLLAKYFGPKPEARLALVEEASLDKRRKLMLIRRDGVEHLIMTGGPVDVVIETNISGAGLSSAAATTRVVTKPLPADRSDSAIEPSLSATPAATAASTPPVFGRSPRKLGSVVNE